MNFTDSPFEKMMKQTPRKYPEERLQPPQDSPCCGCSFWRGMACIGFCYKEGGIPGNKGKTVSGTTAGVKKHG